MTNQRLSGADEIAEFLHRCGRSKKPARQTISVWRNKHSDFPVIEDDGGKLVVDGIALRKWALKHKKIPPSTAEELEEIQKGVEIPENSPDILKDLGGGDLDHFLDLEIFNDYPEPTGEVEDELREARKLRHLFGRIVFSWRLDTLGNPKAVKNFQDFASGLTRQIAVIGRLEESLTKQRMRNGKLLDESTVLEWSRAFGAHVVSDSKALSKDLFDIVDEEVGRLAAEKEIDFSMNSDRVLKLFEKRFAEQRKSIAATAVQKAKEFQADQVERLGGEEE